MPILPTKDEIRRVDCPQCGVLAGQRCTADRGIESLDGHHAARINAARQAGTQLDQKRMRVARQMFKP